MSSMHPWTILLLDVLFLNLDKHEFPM